MELLAHYKTVRERLRNPPNARLDDGIDLRRRPFAVPRIKHRFPPKPTPIPDVMTDGRPTIPSVIRAVSRAFGIPMKHICGEGRKREIVRPRHIAAALAYRLTGKSLLKIGYYLGGRDHTSILHACRSEHAKAALAAAELKVGASLDPVAWATAIAKDHPYACK
jgi:hypothetical protein